VLFALAVLVLNDQVVPAAWPGFVTGTLSAIAGLIVAPLALQAVWEVVTWASGRWHGPSEQALVLAIILVGVGFVAVQVWPPATDAYRWAQRNGRCARSGACSRAFRRVGSCPCPSRPTRRTSSRCQR
jgi:hypothetical protein